MGERQATQMALACPQEPLRAMRLEKGPLEIGRDASCDVCLPDERVSRRHARLERDDGGAWRIRDLGSRNGTLINGRAVRTGRVCVGDVIEIGSFRLVLRLPDDGPAAAPELEIGADGAEGTTVGIEGGGSHPAGAGAESEMRRELAQARAMQMGLLPGAPDVDPSVEIAGDVRACFAVSGDVYDCRCVAPGKVAFLIADAAGHGLRGALATSRLQAAFRLGLSDGRGLSGLSRRLDAVMQGGGAHMPFATGILGMCDADAGVLSLLCAGHPWPSILVEGRRIGRVASACGMPWGVQGEGQFPSPRPVRIRLGGRWSVLAYTDGIVEARNARGDTYSPGKLGRLHAARRDAAARVICREVLADVLRHVGPGRRIEDDMTVLAIRRRPGAPAAAAPKAPSRATAGLAPVRC